MENNDMRENGNGNVEASEIHFEENGHSKSNNNNAWQTVVYPKKQRKQHKAANLDSERIKVNGDDKSVFLSIEQHAEERRKKMDALLRAGAFAVDAQASNAVKHTVTASDEDDESDGENANKATSGKEEKKKKPKEPKKPRITVPKAASDIDPSSLSSHLAEITASYEGNHEIQLYRLLDYFARAFSQVAAAQFPLNKIFKETPLVKLAEIPLCYLPGEIYKVSSEWIARQPEEPLRQFSLWALTDLLEDFTTQPTGNKKSKQNQQTNSRQKVAVLLQLAIILKSRPEVLLRLTQTITSDKQFQGQDKAILIAWATAQVCHSDLVSGMQSWVQVMLPLAVGKSSTPLTRDIALQLVESCILESSKKSKSILLNGAIRKGVRLIPPSAFVSIMQASFPLDSARTKATERFVAIYPLIKELALAGSHRSKATKPVAQQLLPLCLGAVSHDNPLLSKEAADIFIWCLSQNQDCYKQWEKLHMDHIWQSNFILGTMLAEWKSIRANLSPMDKLKQTLKSLSLKHKQALDDKHADGNFEGSVKAADKNCKILLGKLGSRVAACFRGTVVGAFLIALLAFALMLLLPSLKASEVSNFDLGQWKDMLPFTFREMLK
eukprot:TRINITY_DN2904_c0_g1_i1.p1 TRINITY_DN2904_c0_g1~~TRINITY_DN2904_c0_g1_i1.p1  ORF type:complete len:609 (-),score=134.49 TRINITY_DN2904_c0_g1_i1:413-2239(-)